MSNGRQRLYSQRLYARRNGTPVPNISGPFIDRRIKTGLFRAGVTSPEYVSYHSAKLRCSNPRNKDYPDYGGRGIEFRFTSFAAFYAELGPRPAGKSLDRFPNNNGHYESGNVRWATAAEQTANRRAFKALNKFSDAELVGECQRRGLWPT